MLDQLQQDDPEKYRLVNKQMELRDQLREKVDELTDAVMQEVREQRRSSDTDD